MLIALVLCLGLALLFFKRTRREDAPTARDTTPALDAWIRATLERELARVVLGISHPSREERKKLVATLGDEPEPELVAKIEGLVRGVEIEYVRYAHEPDVGATLKLHFESGSTVAHERRFSSAEVPAEVATELAQKGTTRVFRSWTFPWQRVTTL